MRKIDRYYTVWLGVYLPFATCNCIFTKRKSDDVCSSLSISIEDKCYRVYLRSFYVLYIYMYIWAECSTVKLRLPNYLRFYSILYTSISMLITLWISLFIFQRVYDIIEMKFGRNFCYREELFIVFLMCAHLV